MMDASLYAEITDERSKGMTWKEISSKHKGVSAGALMQKWLMQRDKEGKGKPKAKRQAKRQPVVKNGRVDNLDLLGMLSQQIGVAKVAERRAVEERKRLERAREIIRGL